MIATLLSFVAGTVNVVGVLSVHILTTNVTGHFAFFVDEVFNLRFSQALFVLLYTLSFFLGAFTSNTLVELVSKASERYVYVFPIAIEIAVLTFFAFAGERLYLNSPNIIALSLLFAMGMQNALVTKISNALVRTTHLTGLFTDLGIEVSQLLFYTTKEQRQRLLSTIQLRMLIITFFFLGGVVAGVVYSRLAFYTLLIPAGLLIIGLIYDNIKFRILRWSAKR